MQDGGRGTEQEDMSKYTSPLLRVPGCIVLFRYVTALFLRCRGKHDHFSWLTFLQQLYKIADEQQGSTTYDYQLFCFLEHSFREVSFFTLLLTSGLLQSNMQADLMVKTNTHCHLISVLHRRRQKRT